MIIAELRNKLSSDGRGLTDRSEDLLTSNVFGLLRYLPAMAVLLPWLRAAKPFVPGVRPLIAADAREAHIEFWPRVREREMDLCLLANGPSGREIVGIECKLESAASPAEGERSVPERSFLLRRGDQLADYWDGLRHDEVQPAPWPPSEAPPRALLYLTADLVCPTETFRTALDHIRPEARDEAARAFYWTHWQSLPDVLHAYLEHESDVHRRQIALDLVELLDRKSLMHFRGFTSPRPACGSVTFLRRFAQPFIRARELHFYVHREETRS